MPDSCGNDDGKFKYKSMAMLIFKIEHTFE